MTRKEIADRVSLDIADELLRERLLAVKKGHDGKPWYELTHAAVRLVNAKLIKRINRAKAEFYVAELLQRADDINANPDLLYRVKRITAFGSYITDAADLGDIDIAVELECKVPPEQIVQANQARARALGRKSLSFSEELSVGQREVDLLLKGRNPYISLIFYDSLQRLNTPTKVIYPRPEG
jgi:predicted nucleotidyltransferase